jgi:hypothetical protein
MNEPSVLSHVLTDIVEALCEVQEVDADGIIDEQEKPRRDAAIEKILDCLVEGERVELSIQVGIQVIRRGYDRSPDYRLLDRVARFEADPRRRKMQQREAGLIDFEEKKKVGLPPAA